MIILGIDPGSIKLGYAAIRVENKYFKIVRTGVLDYRKEKEFFTRILKIPGDIGKLISEFSPDEIALESLVYVKNINSLSKLAQARGAICAGFGEKYIDKVYEYAPNLVKSSVTSFGHASKNSVQKGLGRITGKKDFTESDESDALAIAICHFLLRTSYLHRKTNFMEAKL